MSICSSCRVLIIQSSLKEINSCPSSRMLVVGPSIPRRRKQFRVSSMAVDSQESTSDFAKRTEQAWMISQQPRPVACTSCNSNGYVECKWCGGTGFFIIGDNMLCEVPSRNTSCVICAGKGSTCCADCKGTGFRAKWLGEPSPAK
ncbi:hypothetical protein ACLOJK_002692 [Asimina triloba]